MDTADDNLQLGGTDSGAGDSDVRIIHDGPGGIRRHLSRQTFVMTKSYLRGPALTPFIWISLHRLMWMDSDFGLFYPRSLLHHIVVWCTMSENTIARGSIQPVTVGNLGTYFS